MITNFEIITSELDRYEQRLVSVFADILKDHVGKENAITNKRMREKLLTNNNINIKPARVRKIIHFLRVKDVFQNYALLASSQGYYLSNNPEEIDKQIESLEQRMNSIDDVRVALDYKRNLIEYQKVFIP